LFLSFQGSLKRALPKKNNKKNQIVSFSTPDMFISIVPFSSGAMSQITWEGVSTNDEMAVSNLLLAAVEADKFA
jgi:hypothetical protein